MKVSMVGLGKLGLPVSVAIAQKGHTVYGYDIDKEKMEQYIQGYTDLYEPNIRAQLGEVIAKSLFLCDSLEEVGNNKPDIVFIAVPTPSLPTGAFITDYVEDVIRKLNTITKKQEWFPLVAIISTILPTTMREKLSILMNDQVSLLYNPSFIAMGTVIEDYLTPEFILIGEESSAVGKFLENFYRTIITEDTPVLHMTWENAEIVKMRYNTYIGFKIMMANENMELCHKIPHADCDVVSYALSKATKRITSGAYFKGGMGDGGECHPRDQRALAWLGGEIGLSTNLNDYVTQVREVQTEWLATMLQKYKLPIVIMGKRFKANSGLTTDSASILLHDILASMDVKSWFYDPPLGLTDIPDGPCAFLASIDEDWVNHYSYPSGSVVLDVWRRFTLDDVKTLKRQEVEYVPVGRGFDDGYEDLTTIMSAD